MLDQPLPDSPLVLPDGATPPDAWDETLRRAIEAGRLDPSQAGDGKLAGAFAAHQKLESLFAVLRGEPADQPEAAPTHLGRYQVRSTLGAGAFGTVYLAYDPELNRDVAIKVSRADPLSSGKRAKVGADDDPLSLRERARVRADNDSLSLRERARVRADAIASEARHAARLNHAGIVSVYDVGREGERLYIVMEYVPGRTLAEVMGDGPIAPLRAVDLLASVADALHYAHKRGFVHRDLKPANILLDESGRVAADARGPSVGNALHDVPLLGRPLIADFGLAVTDETQRALAGQVAGTPAYMSPEQCRGAAHHLDGRADIWSLGVIGYELLTGRQPFWHGDALACLDAIQHRDPKPPRQIDDTIPLELERIILKCLAKQPTDRYSTAGDLATDLHRWRRTQRAGSGTGRRALIAAALVLAVALAVFGWRSTRVPTAAATQPLTGTIDVRLWNPDDPARRGLTLGDSGALPLRIGDQVRVEASVSEPSYVYIVWLGADGGAHPVYPWRNGDWKDRTAEKPISRLSLPNDPTLGWPMSGPPGTETLLLLARRSPLRREIDLRELLRGLPDIVIPDPRMLVRLDEGKVGDSLKRAPELSTPQAIDDPILVVQRFLTERLENQFDLHQALSFAVKGTANK
jgi:serine/threonine protein kinase